MTNTMATDGEVERLINSIRHHHSSARLSSEKVKLLMGIIGQTETDARPQNDPTFHVRVTDNTTTISQSSDSWPSSTMPQLMSASQLFEEYYRMEHDPRGPALIICNREFNRDTRNLPKRDGTEEDMTKMECRFREKGFEPDVKFDLTKDETLDALKRIARYVVSHRTTDCFVCVVLSHGDENGIDAKDEKMTVEELVTPFYASNCPTLAGKPKIFIIQCCRGSKFCAGLDVCDPNVSDAAPDYREYSKQYPDSSDIRIPDHADFLVIYSSAAGHKSFRNTVKGSPFIVNLSEELEKMSDSDDIIEVLTRMNQRFYRYKPDPSTPEFVGKAQMPCFESTLTKKLKFPQGI